MRFLGRKFIPTQGGSPCDCIKLVSYFLPIILLSSALIYGLGCLGLYWRQEQILYEPNHKISASSPQDLDFQLDYQNVWIDVPNSSSQIHGWWFDAPQASEPIIALTNEPVNILQSPKTILYLCGRGGSKTHYNNLARIKGFQQLGFSVLAIDYRGYGLSEGELPNEARLYEDAQAAWDYLKAAKLLLPEDIVLYGESLGGAVAVELAVNQPEAAGLIVQSSFTSMVEQAQQISPLLRWVPLGLILHQRFESVEKVARLKMPVLFLHGTADQVVDPAMSQRLFERSAEPKTLFYISQGEHLRLYQPDADSYLLAIQRFMSQIEAGQE